MIKKNLFILFTLVNLILAGTDGTIRGRVTSGSDGQPLPGVQVFIGDLGVGSVSDLDGNFLILNVPVGEHEVTVAMIGYKTIKSNLSVTMDKTTWYNPSMDSAALEGETVYVSGERELVEKGKTSKKVTVNKEAIEALPIKDVSELYSLQAGVVKIDAGVRGGVPDNEEKGLEEVHVRGGRSGEIAYMIDGLYIRNPIFGGIGSGTRLNLFAIKEFDWQPGGFNAEYGDAMSAVSNMHTMAGGKKYQFKYKWESSLVGAMLGNEYDDLRGFNDQNFGFGGPVPFTKNKLKFWVSSQLTDNDKYRVYEFDNLVFRSDDPNNRNNREDLVAPWDTKAGMQGFGFQNTWDVFGKLSYQLGKSLRFNTSYWTVSNHRKIFDRRYMYWNEGQNELFRDTDRFTVEVNHTLTPRLFYTLRYSKFNQESFQGVRWQDSDSDGYPDWYEWSHPAGERDYSDPYNADVIPYNDANGISQYINKDGLGPNNWTSGWYVGADPGTYNWEVAEAWDDLNGNGVFDQSEYDAFINCNGCDLNGNGEWDGPVLIEEAIERDGSYWLLPEMYVDYEDFEDEYYFFKDYSQDPYNSYYDPNNNGYFQYLDSLYFLPSTGEWSEGFIFGGSDRFYGTSSALTEEVRLDLTSQFTNEWRARFGFDIKSHKLDFYEVENPWDDAGAFTQRFAEQWDDFGIDGIPFTEDREDNFQPDEGEGNGTWDGGDGTVDNPGEAFTDFNDNDEWDNFVEPFEISAYWQNTFEVPWMVINAGVRVDFVNYNTQVWANPELGFSPNQPWFYLDYGLDGLEWKDLGNGTEDGDGTPDDDWFQDLNGNGIQDENEPFDWFTNEDGELEYEVAPDAGEADGQYNSNGNGIYDGFNSLCSLCGNEEYEDLNDNGQYDEGEPFIDEGEPAGLLTQALSSSDKRVIFKPSEWLYEISPRVGFSHVITDKATFTFNYGVYHQTPVYQNIYLNTNRQENPEEVFEESAGYLGNATMTASRTQSYEFAFNVQVGNNWAYTVGAWVKDMDRLVTAKTFRSGVYEYQVADNGEFGRAIGIDLTLENRGMAVNSVIQYTYSTAKANGDYDESAFGNAFVDAPAQEYLMPFDRTHDLTATFYTKLPFGINAGLTCFYQSGIPYTPFIFNAGGDKPIEDVVNKNSNRTDAYRRVDLSFSKYLAFKSTKVTLGLNVYNLLNISNVNDIYPLTGRADDPGSYYYDTELALPVNGGEISSGYYDRPWMYSSPREINFFARFDFN